MTNVIGAGHKPEARKNIWETMVLLRENAKNYLGTEEGKMKEQRLYKRFMKNYLDKQ